MSKGSICNYCTTPAGECRWLLDITPYKGSEVKPIEVCDKSGSTGLTFFTSFCPYYNCEHIPKNAPVMPRMEGAAQRAINRPLNHGITLTIYGEKKKTAECAKLAGKSAETIRQWIKTRGEEYAINKIIEAIEGAKK